MVPTCIQGGSRAMKRTKILLGGLVFAVIFGSFLLSTQKAEFCETVLPLYDTTTDAKERLDKWDVMVHRLCDRVFLDFGSRLGGSYLLTQKETEFVGVQASGEDILFKMTGKNGATRMCRLTKNEHDKWLSCS